MPAEISDLPNEVLLMIFSNLSFYDIVHSVKAVCSRWRDLGKRQCLWTTNGVIKWVKEASNLEDFLHRVRVIGRNLDTLSFRRIQKDWYSSTLVTDIEHIYSVKYGGSNEIEIDSDDDDEFSHDISYEPLVFSREDIRCPNVKAIHVVESDMSWSNFRQLLKKYSSVTEVVSEDNIAFDIHNPERFMPELRKLANLTHLTVKCNERDNSQIDGIWQSDRWNEELENLVRAHPNLTYLDVTLPRNSKHTIGKITKSCQKLRTLKMNGDMREDLEDLSIDTLPFLEELSLYDFRMKSQDFKSILEVVCAGRRLEKLSLINCFDVKEDTYQVVSEQCPLLRRFVGKEDEQFVNVKNRLILRCGPMMYTSINYNALKYLSTCRHLQEISIGDSSGKAVTDEGIGILARGCPQMKIVNFHGCVGITDLGVVELARHCSKLSKVDLKYCCHVTGLGFSCLLLNCQVLQDVKMTGCCYLKKVILCKDQRFPDIPVASLNRSVYEESKPYEIWCSTCKKSINSKSNICTEIVRSHREIKALHGITEERIVQTSRENTLDDSVALNCTQLEPFRVSSDHYWIQVLELYNCESLCDSDIIKICKYCPEIRRLDVGSNKNLSDTSIVAISRYLTLLTTLGIEGIDRLTNDSLAALAKTGLVNLSLQACPKMTTTGLGDFLTTNKTLEKIEVCHGRENIAVAFWSNSVEKLLERISTEKVLFVMTNNPCTYWFNIEARRKS